MEAKRMQTIQARFDAARKTMETECREVGEKAVREVLAAFFEQCPSITAVRWTQYTPYFNDGEPCVFGVNSPYVRFDPAPDDDEENYSDSEDEEGRWFSSWTLKQKPVALQKAVEELEEILSKCENVLLLTFGDHAQVTATRESIEVDEYSHD